MAKEPDESQDGGHSHPAPRRSRKSLWISLTLASLLAAAGVTAWLYPNIYQSRTFSNKTATAQPNPELYAVLKADLEIRRQRLSERYRKAQNASERQHILAEAQQLLDCILPKMMRCWLGTPWDFYGTSDTPGSGKIACGYFVSTVMRDAGFRVDRYKLAQQPSQNILETFVNRSRRTVRAGLSYKKFVNLVASQPPGIYIVGLDSHVGFIVNSPESFHFIHSSGITPHAVVDEAIPDAYSLEHSNYRVFGNVTGETDTLISWLYNKPFKVKGT